MRFVLIVLLAACGVPFSKAETAALTPETKSLRELLAAEWEYTMEQSPVWASQLGDRRWNDRWPDLSVAAEERGAAHGREFLARLG